MKEHLMKSHNIDEVDIDGTGRKSRTSIVPSVVSSFPLKSFVDRAPNPDSFKKVLVEFVVEIGAPLSLVENPSLAKFVKAIRPAAVSRIPKRQAALELAKKIYQKRFNKSVSDIRSQTPITSLVADRVFPKAYKKVLIDFSGL